MIYIETIVVANYVEYLGGMNSKPTVKQYRAAGWTLFDWAVTGGVLPVNPATPVCGPSDVSMKSSELAFESLLARP
ncbi:MAG: hypothetical protein NT069_24460 [Planctomycetota bacterium]|nr:hypothetical protein [Planctomycetota bacterium]